MSEVISKENILNYLKSWTGFDTSISEENEAFRVTLTKGDKSVILTAPYEVGEFFLDFLIKDSLFYSDWYEIMEDPLNEFMAYTEQVVKSFLFNEVRVASRGWWGFKTHELQFNKNDNWQSVFNPET